MKLNPIQLEIMSNKVAAAAEEMYFTLQRSSRSGYVKEAADFATAILDADGNIFAYPPSATFNFLIDTNYISTIRAVPDLAPGDVIVTNDPYLSEALSTHLPDLHLIRPYFHQGRIVAHGWCFAHLTDVGGAVPSSMSPAFTEIFQEGLRIPPMKLVKRGVYNEDFIKIFSANSRTPEVNLGDLRAMVGSLETGAKRVEELIQRHGLATFLATQRDLQDYTAAKARDVLRRIPDGEYEFWDYMDDDMVSRVPIRVRVRMIARDGRLHLDLTGTDPQVKTAYNVPTNGGRNYWLTFRLTNFLTTYDKSMAKNAGLYRDISVTNPKGNILNAEFPDAVCIRASAPYRLYDALSGAILKAAPELMSAATGGTMCPFALAEIDPRTGKRVVHVIEPLRVGMGAFKSRDGVDARDNSMNNMRNHPVEMVEADSGVVVREYDVRADSGGPGQWRGGVGQVMTVEIVRDGGVIVARGMERLRFPPWGVAGGKPGAVLRAFLNHGRAGGRELGKIHALPVKKGDTITLMLPGGGGYGDPFRRDPRKVLEDVELGFVSPEAAERDYGVVVAAGRIDEVATERLRRGRVRDNVRADFDFGSEREAWERVFDDAAMRAINQAVYRFPKSIRQEKRRWLFDRVVNGLSSAGNRPLAEMLADHDAARGRLAEALAELAGSHAAD